MTTKEQIIKEISDSGLTAKDIHEMSDRLIPLTQCHDFLRKLKFSIPTALLLRGYAARVGSNKGDGVAGIFQEKTIDGTAAPLSGPVLDSRDKASIRRELGLHGVAAISAPVEIKPGDLVWADDKKSVLFAPATGMYVMGVDPYDPQASADEFSEMISQAAIQELDTAESPDTPEARTHRKPTRPLQFLGTPPIDNDMSITTVAQIASDEKADRQKKVDALKQAVPGVKTASEIPAKPKALALEKGGQRVFENAMTKKLCNIPKADYWILYVEDGWYKLPLGSVGQPFTIGGVPYSFGDFKEVAK